jgi:hypothetical protein
MAAQRPPSEQGVEYQLLDRLTRVTEQLEAFEQRPGVGCPSANWWDQLPEGAREFFQEGIRSPFYLPTQRAELRTELYVTGYHDRVELALRFNQSFTAWQRALFFGPKS